MPKMTPALVTSICREHGGYRTPELNSQIHLHFKGFEKIEGLEEYTEVVVLWLESNALSAIENLSHMSRLNTLYMQQNALQSLTASCVLPSLKQLNVGHNQLRSLEGLDAFPNLEKLMAANNIIESVVGLSQLVPQLTVLDLSHNELEMVEETREEIKKLDHLCSLTLNGNPFLRKLKNYRHWLIADNVSLHHLDEMPVRAEERRCVAAWVLGGVEAEKAERKKIDEEAHRWQKAQQEEFSQLYEESVKVGDRKREEHPEHIIPDTNYFTTMKQLAEEEGEEDLAEDADTEITTPSMPYVPTQGLIYKGNYYGPPRREKAAAKPPSTVQHHVDPTARVNEEELGVEEGEEEESSALAFVAGSNPTLVNAADSVSRVSTVSEVRTLSEKEDAPEKQQEETKDPKVNENAERMMLQLHAIFDTFADAETGIMAEDDLHKFLSMSELFTAEEVAQLMQLLCPSQAQAAEDAISASETTATEPSYELHWENFIVMIEILSMVLYNEEQYGAEIDRSDRIVATVETLVDCFLDPSPSPATSKEGTRFPIEEVE